MGCSLSHPSMMETTGSTPLPQATQRFNFSASLRRQQKPIAEEEEEEEGNSLATGGAELAPCRRASAAAAAVMSRASTVDDELREFAAAAAASMGAVEKKKKNNNSSSSSSNNNCNSGNDDEEEGGPRGRALQRGASTRSKQSTHSLQDYYALAEQVHEDNKRKLAEMEQAEAAANIFSDGAGEDEEWGGGRSSSTSLGRERTLAELRRLELRAAAKHGPQAAEAAEQVQELSRRLERQASASQVPAMDEEELEAQAKRMRPPADRDRSLLRADQEQLKMQLRDVWQEMEHEREERDRLERIRESMEMDRETEEGRETRRTLDAEAVERMAKELGVKVREGRMSEDGM